MQKIGNSQLELNSHEYANVAPLLYTKGKRNDFVLSVETGWGMPFYITFESEKDRDAIAGLVCNTQMK